MNQKQTHKLRKLFLSIQPFPENDPRNKTAWREFKTKYNAQPSNRRAAYLSALAQKVETLTAAQS